MGLLMLTSTLHYFFQTLQPFLLAVYARDLCVRDERWPSRSLVITAIPALVGCLLVLMNPFTGTCFVLDEVSGLVWGAEFWFLNALAAVYLLYSLLRLVRAGDVLPKHGRRHALALVVLALVGTGVEMLMRVPVRSLFWAVALFGAMVLLEPEDADVEGGARERLRTGTVVAVLFVFAATIVMNALIIQHISSSQIERIGTVELEAIKGDLEDTISSAETDLLRVAMGAEQLIDSGASREELEQY